MRACTELYPVPYLFLCQRSSDNNVKISRCTNTA